MRIRIKFLTIRRNQLLVHENPYQMPDSQRNELIVHENPYQMPDSHKE